MTSNFFFLCRHHHHHYQHHKYSSSLPNFIRSFKFRLFEFLISNFCSFHRVVNIFAYLVFTSSPKNKKFQSNFIQMNGVFYSFSMAQRPTTDNRPTTIRMNVLPNERKNREEEKKIIGTHKICRKNKICWYYGLCDYGAFKSE